MNWQQLEGLELANMGQWPPFAKGMVLCLLSLFWLAAGSYFVVLDNFNHWQHSQQQTIELSEKLSSMRLQVATLLAMKQQLSDAQQELNQQLTNLPSRIEVASLLDGLGAMINTHELHLERINWEQAQVGEFVTKWPMRIVVQGDYHQLGRFVAAVAALSQLVIIDEFSLTRPENKIAPLLLTMNMVAKTYTYQEKEPAKTQEQEQ